ncbi:hypothetical protein DMA11_11520 [Marinilabiliaceae bacterium JC017]|nr:hypothetical protein DMA11_11520 [Marinilabiliaceae bacterium JC017]
MIKSISFSQLRIDECNTLGMRVAEVVNQFNVEELGLKGMIDTIYAHLKTLQLGLSKGNVKLLTAKVKDCDINRDDASYAFKYYVKAFVYCSDEDKRVAAELLENFITQYGRYERMNYRIETSRLRNLLKNLADEPELKEAVATISGEFFVHQLRQAQEAFEQSEEARVDERSVRPQVDNKEAVKALKSALETLFQYLEVMQKVNPKPEFDEMINLINIIIDKTMTTVRIRQGRRDAQKEVEKVVDDKIGNQE